MKLFSKQNLKKKEKQNDNIYRLLLPSFFAICICTICLSTATWAWFTSTTSTSVSSIRSSSYILSYKVNIGDDKTEIALQDTTTINGSASYTMTTDNCIITLSVADTSTASAGYCVVSIDNDVFYTKIFGSGTYSFTIYAPVNTQITLTPEWGSYPSSITIDESNQIDNNGILGTPPGENGINTTSNDDLMEGADPSLDEFNIEGDEENSLIETKGGSSDETENTTSENNASNDKTELYNTSDVSEKITESSKTNDASQTSTDLSNISDNKYQESNESNTTEAQSDTSESSDEDKGLTEEPLESNDIED